MSHGIWFSHAARLELDEATAWYEAKQPGLGRDLESEVNSVLQIAAQRPERFAKVTAIIRKARLHKFRYYAVYFMESAQRIDVLAVFHGKQNPDKLRRRLGKQ